MPRTAEQIEADIQAVKQNPNWATNDAALNAIAAFTIEKSQLTQGVPPAAGKYIPNEFLYSAKE